MKKILALLCAGVLAAGCFWIFAQPATGSASPGRKDAGVYYLNFKPEQAAQWQQAARLYTQETGVPVTVVTAASGTYEDTLRSELEKNDPPTLFQVNGPIGLKNWRDWCLDLRNTVLAEQLADPSFALHDGQEIPAVAYAIETYGIVCNKTLLARAGYAPQDITSFARLKAAAEDIQARKKELGVLGAFTSAGMDASSDWRFKTHLANLPLYYEFRDRNVTSPDTVEGTYLPQFQQIWDLYLNNAVCEPGVIGARTGEDAAAEFALGEAVFYQNGTWAYQDLITEGLTDEDLAFLPIYIGVPGEENQGLCTGSENYWCINRHADPEDIEATKAFLSWLLTSESGKQAFMEMGFAVPFKGFEGMQASNALSAAAQSSLAAGKAPVSWAFTAIPSDTWKNNVGAAMLEYAQGTAGWDAVQRAFVDGWASESAAAR